MTIPSFIRSSRHVVRIPSHLHPAPTTSAPSSSLPVRVFLPTNAAALTVAASKHKHTTANRSPSFTTPSSTLNTQSHAHSSSASSAAVNEHHQHPHQHHDPTKPLTSTIPSNTQSRFNAPSDDVVDRSVAQAVDWASSAAQVRKGGRNSDLVAKLAGDEKGVEFVLKFTDWVMRTESPAVAARALSQLIASDTTQLPAFMSAVDRALIQLGGSLAPWLPSVVVQTARLRMRAMVSPFVGVVEGADFRRGGMKKNVNLLGEAVLGTREANHRRREAETLLTQPGVDYVSVKVSGVTAQLKPWDFDGSLERVVESLRPLFEKARAAQPRVLLNLDMEEYHDLDLTVAAFTRLLSEDRFADLDAGIVVQTYLPDALPVLQRLVTWANDERPGLGEVKIRVVKGANLAMEKVDAVMHGWQQAPYESKTDTDANFLRCIDWLLTPNHLRRVRVGVASHNLFSLAYAKVTAADRGVEHRVGFENLMGMTPAHTQTLAKDPHHDMLLYAPICRTRDFDSSIAYLFRRFEESTTQGNFLRSLSTLEPGSDAFRAEETQFRAAIDKIPVVSVGPRRVQHRPAHASHMTELLRGTGGNDGNVDDGQSMPFEQLEHTFVNEPDSDPTLPNVRAWVQSDVLNRGKFRPVSSPNFWVQDLDQMDKVLHRAREAAAQWNRQTSRADRRAILAKTADEIARRRGDFLNAMVYEGSKTVAEGDPELSEAVDFANYYALMAEGLPSNFEPFGVITVAAPWNFPSAIGAGGAFAALAAGNSVILKPSPHTPRCLELAAECAWAAGVPRDALQFVQCPENEVGKRLITGSDAVILTGATDTAELFRSWQPDMRLFAETSGKNATVITPAADLDAAVKDLVHSAFSNGGQKCSASSLGILVGEVYNSERFRRQLKDAVESMRVGPAHAISTSVAPLIEPPGDKLRRALTKLDAGEEWLVQPRCLDPEGEGRLWSPGVRMHVKPGTWFHETEVFGPVLGLMHAKDLDEALEFQNATKYGLTGGIHSLDAAEIDRWSDGVAVGNAYVNRGTTGAIVRRQCFGGWKASVVGPGAKAGGPNYVSQLGIIRDPEQLQNNRDATWLANATNSDEHEWQTRFSQGDDPTNLFCESNTFRYRPLPAIAIRVGPNANPIEAHRVRSAAARCNVPVVHWSDEKEESATDFAQRLQSLGVDRVRVVGDVETDIVESAAKCNIHVASAPVVQDGRYELLHYLREQSVARTRHRFGNMVTA